MMAKWSSGLWTYHILLSLLHWWTWVISVPAYFEEWCYEPWCIRLCIFWFPHVFSWMLNCWLVITLCLTCWEIVKWVTREAIAFCRRARVTGFSTPLSALAVLCLLVLGLLVDEKWSLWLDAPFPSEQRHCHLLMGLWLVLSSLGKWVGCTHASNSAHRECWSCSFANC